MFYAQSTVTVISGRTHNIIIHEHIKHRVLYLRVWRAHTHIRNSDPYQLNASTHALTHRPSKRDHKITLDFSWFGQKV